MSMDESNRRQTIQLLITFIVLLTLFGVVFAITSCSPTKTSADRTYTAKEQAYLTEVRPVLGTSVDTALEESSVIAIGKLSCQQREAGIPPAQIIEGLKNSYTEMEARVMVNSAEKFFCK